MTFCFDNKLIDYYNLGRLPYDSYIHGVISQWRSSMMKYYATKHKNKTPVGETDVFRAIHLLIHSFICLFIYLFWHLFKHPVLILNYLAQLLSYVTSTPPWCFKSTSPELYPNYIIVAYFYLSFTVREAASFFL